MTKARALVIAALGAGALALVAVAAGWLPGAAVMRQPAPSATFDLLYKVPVAGKPEGPVFLASLNAAGVTTGVPRPIGIQVTARVVSSNAAQPAAARKVVLIGSGVATRLDVSAPDRTQTHPGDGTEATLLTAAGTIYQAADHAVMATLPDGRVLTSAVPVPATGTPTLDGNPIKVAIAADAARVGALVTDLRGHVYAFVDNSMNSLLFDLTDSRTLNLAGYGRILGATLAGDGHAYALALDPSRSTNANVVLQIDPATMTFLGSVPIPIRPADGEIDDRPQILSTSIGDIWVYASQQSRDDPSAHRSRLIRISSTGAQETALPTNLGTRLTTNATGTLYVFGGPAREVVRTIDPSSGTSSIVTRAPEGSFVLEVFAH